MEREDCISVHVTKYDALLDAQAKLDVLKQAYSGGMKSYQLEDAMYTVFGPRPEDGNAE